MHLPNLLAVVLVALPILACSGSSSGTGTSGNGAGTSGAGTGPGVMNGQAGAGTCDGACAHYLMCKAAENTANRAQCNHICAGEGYTAQQLADFEQADCATAIAAIEGTGGTTSGGTTSGGTTSGGTTSGGTATDCNGCQWDGSSCIWISPSTGLYQACGTGCCPGH